MTSPVASARVEITADLKKFKATLQADIATAMQGVEKQVDSTAAAIERAFTNAARDSGRAVSRDLREAFVQVGAEGNAVGRGIQSSLKGVERAAGQTGRAIERDLTASFAEAAAASKIGEEVIDSSLRGVERRAGRASRAIEEDFAEAAGSALAVGASLEAANLGEKVLSGLASIGSTIGSVFSNIGGVVESAVGQVEGGVSDLGSVFASLGEAVGPAIGGITAVAEAMSTLEVASIAATAVATLAQAVLSLGNGIAQMLPLLLTLPGALTSAVAVFGVLYLGVQNVGQAFKDLASGDIKAVNDDLKQLAPNAAAVVRALIPFAPQLRAIGREVQNRLFADLADQMAPIAQNLLPAIKNGANDVADAFNSLLQPFADFLNQSSTAKEAEEIFKNLSDAIKAFKPAIKPASQALEDLSLAFSDLAVEVSGDLSGAVTKFSNNISNEKGTGELTAKIHRAYQAFKDLVDIAKNVTDALENVFSGLVPDADKGDPLKTLKDMSAEFDRLSKSKDVKDIVNDVKDILKELSGPDGKTALATVKGIAGALKDIAPAVKIFGSATGELFLGILVSAGAVSNFFTDTLPSAISTAFNFILSAAESLIAGLLDRFRTIMDFIKSVASQIGNFFVAAWNTIYSTAQVLIVGLIDRFKTIMNFLKSVGSAIGGSFVLAWNTISSAASSAWNSVVSTVEGAVGKIKGFAGSFFNAGKDLITSLFNGLKSVGGFIGDVGSSLFRGIRDELNEVLSSIDSRLDSIRGPLSTIGVNIPHLPRLAAGGIIDRETVLVAGEAGPEAIIPLTRPGRALDVMREAGLDKLLLGSGLAVGGGVNITVVMPTGDPRAAAMAVANRIASLAAAV